MRREDAAYVERIDQEVIESRRPVSFTHSITFPDGETRWLLCSKTPLVDADGAVHTLGVSVDITERKKQDELLAATVEELRRQRQELADKLALIEQQEALIRVLSTPVLAVAEGVLAVPVVGAIDEARAGEITQKLLDEIARTRAAYAILDVTGVDEVDEAMAGFFARLASAIRLLGAEAVLTGMRPAVARSLSVLSVDLGGVLTRSDLRAGLELCRRGARRRVA